MLSKENAEKLKQEREGLENYNHQGLHMVLQTYYGVRKVDILFDDGFVKTTDYKSFVQGTVLNDNYPWSNGSGVGMARSRTSKVKNPKEYRMWRGILTRCNSMDFKIKCPTYKNATCCDEWLYFDNFFEWVISQENYETLKNSDITYVPDKDILVKGNKHYSPETVCLVPQYVNTLFIKRDGDRGAYPLGVFLDKGARHKKYVAKCNNPFGDKPITQRFYSVEDAFEFYKKAKESVIQQMAEREYKKGTISIKCYEAMMNYQVEITD